MAEESKHSRFLSLFAKTQVRLYSYILMVVHSSVHADDIFQETSALLWEHFDKYEEGTNFGAWAVSIAKNKVLEHLRRSKKNRAFSRIDLYEELAVLAEPESTDDELRLKAFRSCLYKLSRPDRLLLSLRYDKDFSVKKIAEQQGLAAGVMYRKLSKLLIQIGRAHV